MRVKRRIPRRPYVQPESWRQLISALSNDVTFTEPASEQQLASVEDALGLKLPDELRGLLSETNGVQDKYGCSLVQSTEGIIITNLEFRSFPDFKELYMPFDPLLLFGEEADSDLYAYVILAGEVRYSFIFVWEHESDSRTWFAIGLQQYLEKRLTAE